MPNKIKNITRKFDKKKDIEKNEDISKTEFDIKKESIKKQTNLKLDNLKNVENTTNFQTIFDGDSDIPEEKIAYRDEVNIRLNYGREIKYFVTKYCDGSVIDENFLYSIIAKESKFDIEAKSYTGVRGLCQITGDTVKDTLELNEEKNELNPESEELFITNISGKNEQLAPLNQIKLAISHLLWLEEKFDNVKDINLKKTLIIASYNLGATQIQKILDKYTERGIKNWNGLKYALIKASKKGQITKIKLNEVIAYVNDVRNYIDNISS